jgi:hypothetical protein
VTSALYSWNQFQFLIDYAVITELEFVSRFKETKIRRTMETFRAAIQMNLSLDCCHDRMQTVANMENFSFAL